jgi:hypothetical protein
MLFLSLQIGINIKIGKRNFIFLGMSKENVIFALKSERPDIKAWIFRIITSHPK